MNKGWYKIFFSTIYVIREGSLFMGRGGMRKMRGGLPFVHEKKGGGTHFVHGKRGGRHQFCTENFQKGPSFVPFCVLIFRRAAPIAAFFF